MDTMDRLLVSAFIPALEQLTSPIFSSLRLLIGRANYGIKRLHLIVTSDLPRYPHNTCILLKMLVIIYMMSNGLYLIGILLDRDRSPNHPAIFATVDGSGSLDLWNLNEDTEVPIIKTPVGSGRALNCLAWSNDGRKILTGDSAGSLYIYDTGEVKYMLVLLMVLDYSTSCR